MTTPSRRCRFAAQFPWTDGTGRPLRRWWQLPLMIPFVVIYIVAAWMFFVPAAEFRDGLYWIDEDAVGHLLFHIPDLLAQPLRALRSLLTGPWLNHDSLQLVYVTALLMTFGAIFELREGTLRIILLFFGTSFAAALLSGFLLHLIYPHLWDIRFLENAWNRSWSGGSAGCFGVMGAIAARARRPFLLLAIFVAWECAIWWINLRNYTSVFHLFAMASGFAIARWSLAPIRRQPARTPGS